MPTPWLMLRPVAPLTLQDNVEELPELIVPGLAVKELIVGGEPVFTETVQLAVVVPNELVADNVYVVVELGATLVLPEAGTVPTELILTLVAPLVAQYSVVELPVAIELGFA